MTAGKQINSCGMCRACCSALTIEVPQDNEEQSERVKKWISSGEDKKPAGVPCPQMNKNPFKYGCSIHTESTKPALCSEYLCSYARGNLGSDPRLRPDNLGVIVDLLEGNRIRIVEIKDRALESSLVKKTMWKLPQLVEELEGEWNLEIIPLNLMGSGLGVSVPINKLTIGRK